MKDITEVVGRGGVLVAEASNGFGKTACALATVLSLNRKAIYVTRTHEQVRQVLLEIERINRNRRKAFSAVNLASRQHLCLNPMCRTLSALEAVDSCRLLKEANLCSYKKEISLSPSTLPLVLSISELRRQGKTVGVVAVDPSSPFTGGVFLGDRVRMQELSTRRLVPPPSRA